MAVRSALMNVMIGAVRKAGRGLTRDFGEVEQLQVSIKGPGDFVSAADLKAEETLVSELGRARPNVGFLTEERDEILSETGKFRWIIDPLDGTTNFLHGIPHWSISLAYEREGELMAAVVYQPVSDELFLAEKGSGAFLNDRRLRVSSRTKLRDCVVATGIPHIGNPGAKRFGAELDQIMGQVAGVRRMGSAALDLCYVAAGRYDGFWERGLKPWDIAAGALIVREAGGVVAQIGGGSTLFETGDILATNGRITAELDGLLAKAA